jgi:hypothetical protein
MRRLTPTDFRFLIRFALSQLPKSLLRDIQLNRPKRDRALDIAADQVCAKFKDHEVQAPDPVKPH